MTRGETSVSPNIPSVAIVFWLDITKLQYFRFSELELTLQAGKTEGAVVVDGGGGGEEGVRFGVM